MSALITEEYRALNAEKHDGSKVFGGVNSVAHADIVMGLCEQYGARDVLDYGAGKGALGEWLFTNGFRGYYFPYDPAIPYWADAPEPADLVACMDVLEHIEPECIEAVLDELKRCVRKVGVFSIMQMPARKTLPDGRNAHILLRPDEWWHKRLKRRFRLMRSEPVWLKGSRDQKVGIMVVVEPK